MENDVPNSSLSSVSNSATDDRSNQYFLHHSGNPGLILVSQPLIVVDNYGSWSRSMMIALSVKNKLGFINGAISRPEGNQEFFNSWIRNNNIVTPWILNSVSKEISAMLYSELSINFMAIHWDISLDKNLDWAYKLVPTIKLAVQWSITSVNLLLL